jgi:hypothetical protein
VAAVRSLTASNPVDVAQEVAEPHARDAAADAADPASDETGLLDR